MQDSYYICRYAAVYLADIFFFLCARVLHQEAFLY